MQETVYRSGIVLPGRFFAVVGDARAYKSLAYMILSLFTGVFAFSWAVTGVSLSLGLAVLVVGLVVTAFFLASFRYLARAEGLLVETLLGVRMPRYEVRNRRGEGLWAQFKAWLTDGRTWTSLAYLLLMLPLGIVYFTLFTTLCSVALSFIAAPFLHYGLGLPLWYGLPVPPGLTVALPVAGILIGVLTLHLARGLGQLHGRLARQLLVET